MSFKAGWSTPLLHVADIERSIAFYRLLGFELIDTDRCEPKLGWARMHCEGGAVMFLRSEHEGAENQAAGVFLYMYSPDLAALREHLIANGVEVSAIKFPGYQPSGMVNLRDPDGCSFEIAHWGRAEQTAWEQRLKEQGAS